MWLEIRSGAEAGRRVQVRARPVHGGPRGRRRPRRPDPKVSRNPLCLGPGQQVLALYDQGSSNGTFVNGQRITQTGVTLAGNEQIQFGDTVLQASANGSATVPVPPGGGRRSAGRHRRPRPPPTQPHPASSRPRRCPRRRQPIAGAPPGTDPVGDPAHHHPAPAHARDADRHRGDHPAADRDRRRRVRGPVRRGRRSGEPTTAEVVENVTPLTTFIASESAVGRSRGTGWISTTPRTATWSPTRTSSPARATSTAWA